jgi:RNA polymerase subunit RPABC4/transcription elongation factor Spt4
MPKTLRGVEIWAAEDAVDGRKVTEQDIQDVVDSFAEVGHVLKPFIKLGHGENQAILEKERQTEGLPAGGWATKVYRVGRKILADFENVPDKLYQLVKAKAYRRVSSEVFHNIRLNGKTYRRALRAVAFLGADTPAIGSLDDILALGYASDAEMQTYETPLTYEEEDVKKCPKCGAEYQEGAKACPKCGEQFSATPGGVTIINNPGGPDEAAIEARIRAEYQVKLDAEAKKAADAQAEVAKFQADKKAAEEQARIDAFTGELQTLIDGGKIAPALKDEAVAIFKSLDAVAVVTYSAGGQEQKATPAEMFSGFLKKASDLGVFKETLPNGKETTEPGQAPDGVDPDSYAIDQETQKYAADHKVDYVTARKVVLASKKKEA